MYRDESDTIGIDAYNAMIDAMAADFRDAGTTDVSNIGYWQSEYKRFAGHNASPICYASALVDAIMIAADAAQHGAGS